MLRSVWRSLFKVRAIGSTGTVDVSGDLRARDVVTGTYIGQITQVYNLVGGSAGTDEYAAAVRDYLRWVEEHTRRLFLRGFPGAGPALDMPLDRIFVPLTGHVWIGAAAERPTMESKRVTLPYFGILGRRVALIGEPGCGKSTLLQYAANRLANALRNDAIEIAEPIVGPVGAIPLPIIVPLGLYAEHRLRFAASPDARQRQLATFVSSYLLERQAGLHLPDDFFSALLRSSHPTALFLDGLDEVRTPAERAVVAQSIRDLVAMQPNVWCVLTSRPHSYESEAPIGGDFRTVRILPLAEDQVTLMVDRMLNAVPAEAAEALDLQSAAARIRSDVTLMRVESSRTSRPPTLSTPLMVRLAFIVRCAGLPIPVNRVRLYDSAIEALLRGTYNPDELVTAYLAQQAIDWRRHREFLQYVAFMIHLQFPNASQRFSEDDLKNVLRPHIVTRLRVSKTETDALLENFAQASRERGSILDVRNELFGFREHGLQEFLAARHLASRDEKMGGPGQFMEDTQRALSGWWREPFLLAIGYLGVAAPDNGLGLLMHLTGLAEDPERRELSPRALATTELAAAAIIEFGIADRDLLRFTGERLADLLTSPQTILDGPAGWRLRVAAGDTLGYIGDPRPGVGGVPMEDGHAAGLFCEIPAGKFTMGSDGERDLLAFAHECPSRSEAISTKYLIARYPTTNAQFANFVSAVDGYSDDGNWSVEGLIWRQSADGSRHVSSPPNHPRVNVSWYEAEAYCAWLERLLKHDKVVQIWKRDHVERVVVDRVIARLPTEREWEKAARGHDGRRYSWGASIRDDVGVERRVSLARTTAVGLFADEDSPYGAMDMCGNVWEWCIDTWSSDVDGRRVVRGGGFGPNRRVIRAACRFGNSPAARHDDLGFRPIVILDGFGDE
jgi:formylglycine-generating enzyme required for sulfatase activity